MSETEEYTDEATKTRLTIEPDIPDHPRVTVYPPENANSFTLEELNEAIQRLIAQAKADGHIAEDKS